MYMGVPIVALARCAVPFTLGNAGLLIDSYNAPEVAEVVAEVCENQDLRESVLDNQRTRLDYFRTERLEMLFDDYIGILLKAHGGHE